MSSEDPFASELLPAPLREALRFSPDNAPLLTFAADTLLKHGGFVHAETLFKRALQLQPDNLQARLGLASTFYQQGKHGAAMVIVEALTKPDHAPVKALLLHARLALRGGEQRLAAELYRRAVNADAESTDDELARNFARVFPNESPRSRGSEFGTSSQDPRADGESEGDGEGRERLPVGGLAGSPEFEVEKPELTFADVGGMEDIKEEIRMKIILPMQQPELYKAYGKKVGGGILLYGPPGCGKTFLARATAGHVNINFVAVGINDVLEMWIGQSEKNLHSLFEHARSNRPCVLFFDEVDALGANRADLLKSGGRQLINQFLSELDGVQSSNEGVLILAATNAPWHLDAAFRRPGRFDRIIFVPPPDFKARTEIVSLQLKGKPTDLIDYAMIARKTDGFSGADIKAVIDLAIEARLRDSLKTGRIKPMTDGDLLAAVKQVRPTTREWFETARNHALYANQSGLYDDVLTFLGVKK
ncbi:MAG: AAA family ATPase [Opitutaceae bacterium]|nr:AAA family ATPase [Opitutaceae bacterium]